MATYALTLPGDVSAHLRMDPGPQLTQSAALVLDTHARTIYDGPTTGYMGYCHAEIAGRLLAPLIGHYGIDADTIDTAVTARFGDVCVCPCECGDCDDCEDDA